MPLINRQKMAWCAPLPSLSAPAGPQPGRLTPRSEPCIRGHRSTKCMHANERLMVPVRKPGRPLSSCPHPSSRACSCTAVTAAIPRRQKCRCGTLQPAPSDAGPDPRTANYDNASPPSPPKATSAAFRVRKQAPRNDPGRKQSIDLAGLGRMNAAHLKIMPSYNEMQRLGPPMSDMAMYEGLRLASDASFTPNSTTYPLFPYSLQSSVIPPPSTKPTANGHASCAPDRSLETSASTTPGACCSRDTGRSQAEAETKAQEVPTTPSAVVSGAPGFEADAFSPFSADSHEHGSSTGSLSIHGVAQQSNSSVVSSPFQPQVSMAVPNDLYPYYPQPTIFSYPPQYGSFYQPLQPEQWRQFMATMNMAQAVAPPTDFGLASSTPFAASGSTKSPAWTSHQCNCGDSCQCVGCAAHPYNEATQNYVRSAWNTVVEEGPSSRAENGGVTTSFINGTSNGNHERSTSLPINGATTPVTSQGEGTTSPVAPPTPSDGTSSHGEEQTLSANDFFFVSYPFSDSCAGDTASCLCGDDCQCIGCVIHSNPGPDDLIHDTSSA